MFKKMLIPLTFTLFVVSLAACGTNPLPQTTATNVPGSSTPAPTALTADTPAATTPTSYPIVDTGQNSVFEEASLSPVAGEYLFTEGPAVDQNGNVYFSDINAGKIYRWSPDGIVTVFMNGLNDPNGLSFDKSGMLIACEGGNGQLISIDPQGQITVLVDQYNGTRFNEPNDLWIDPHGGIYFTDPAYQSSVVQDGEHVYYLSPDRSQVSRVIDDMVRPNGIVGTDDGTRLYVTDHGAGQTFVYDVNADGTLSDKRLFVSVGSDGMTLDAAGNLYLTTPNQVQVYDSAGNQIRNIPTTENPTNVTFAGDDNGILFITARTAVYTIQISVGSSSTTSGFTLTSPEVIEAGALPTEYTCDGASATLALTWSGAPAETKSFAVVMHHVVPNEVDVHWYWVVYDIPAEVTSLSKNSTGIGTLGNNSVNGRTEYAPPCSKGPGEKVYTYTVYALSAQPQFSVPSSQVNRDVLLEAIQDITLTSAELNVTYTRK
ncbi:MAG TPA: SMP-30/gluconolactonase/LRE family protein [Anaerolineaceae bacterium]|nr:SMP-30/gluconolactonase/LRE family protein [Anaerolineaceae bacterium]